MASAPCPHLGRHYFTVPAGWLDCGCGAVRLHECGLHGGLTTERPITELGTEVLRHLEPTYRRNCAGCPDRLRPFANRLPPARRPGRLRVVNAVPIFLSAGTESWWRDLVVGWQEIETSIDPVLWLPDLTAVNRENLDSVPGAVVVGSGDTLRDADAVLVWSMRQRPAWLEGYQGRVVGVSHGAYDWWMAQATPWVNEWVAVAEIAAGCCPGPATVIRNGVDPGRLRPTMTREEARRSLGLAPGEVGVGIVARLSPHKRQALALACWDRLPGNYRLVLVGYGESESELRKLAKPLGGRVIFAGLRRDMRNVYAGLDATLSTSGFEGYGLAIVESLLCGLPTAAFPTGIVDELPVLVGCQPVELIRDAADIPAAVLRVRPPACDLGALTATGMAKAWAEFLRC